MLVGTYSVNEYQARILDELAAIVKHGFGELSVQVWETKGNFKTGVTIKAGRSWVFFVDKELPRNIL